MDWLSTQAGELGLKKNMYTSIITSVEKQTLQEDGSMFLDVEFTINQEDEVIDTKRLAFPLDTSSDEILDEIEKYTAAFSAEQEAMAVNEERDAVYAQADATIEELIGQEVTTNQ